MGVADAVEDEQWLAVVRPNPSRVSIEVGQWPRRGDRHDAAVQGSSSDACEFGLVYLTIGLASPRKRAAERHDLALDPVLEEKPLDPPRIALEQSGHRCKPANPQQLPCMLAALPFPHCQGSQCYSELPLSRKGENHVGNTRTPRASGSRAGFGSLRDGGLERDLSQRRVPLGVRRHRTFYDRLLFRPAGGCGRNDGGKSGLA